MVVRREMMVWFGVEWPKWWWHLRGRLFLEPRRECRQVNAPARLVHGISTMKRRRRRRNSVCLQHVNNFFKRDKTPSLMSQPFVPSVQLLIFLALFFSLSELNFGREEINHVTICASGGC